MNRQAAIAQGVVLGRALAAALAPGYLVGQVALGGLFAGALGGLDDVKGQCAFARIQCQLAGGGDADAGQADAALQGVAVNALAGLASGADGDVAPAQGGGCQAGLAVGTFDAAAREHALAGLDNAGVQGGGLAGLGDGALLAIEGPAQIHLGPLQGELLACPGAAVVADKAAPGQAEHLVADEALLVVAIAHAALLGVGLVVQGAEQVVAA